MDPSNPHLEVDVCRAIAVAAQRAVQLTDRIVLVLLIVVRDDGAHAVSSIRAVPYDPMQVPPGTVVDAVFVRLPEIQFGARDRGTGSRIGHASCHRDDFGGGARLVVEQIAVSPEGRAGA